MTRDAMMEGDGVYISDGVLISDGVYISDGVLISDGVYISDGLPLGNGALYSTTSDLLRWRDMSFLRRRGS